MKSVGIIAEYNPFHNGHLYQINKAKELTGSNIVIVVMSGNYLQRGEPAFIDKWTRTQMALLNGADVVVELPIAFSTQAADYFAYGAVQILNDFQVNTISFGAENGSSEDFKKAGQIAVNYEEEIDEKFSQDKKEKTYAEKMQKAILSLDKSFPIDLTEPNNQLGFVYSKEIYRQNSNISIQKVNRVESGYHQIELNYEGSISSATSIRNALLGGKGISQYVPPNTQEILMNSTYITWEDYWRLLQYKIIASSISELNQIYQMEEGFEYRIKKVAKNSNSFSEFITQLKPKHFTQARMKRLCTYILLNISKVDMKEEMKSVHSSRLLGFTQKGRQYLNWVKKDLRLPLLTKVDQNTKRDWELDIKAGEVYRLAKDKRIEGQDFRRTPLKSIDTNRGN